MDKMFAALLHELERGYNAVLATVIAERGSTPRGAGAQMLVGHDGRLAGTIGGGAVERQAEILAKKQLADCVPSCEVHTFQLQENGSISIGMVCGGDVTVLLQTVCSGDDVWRTVVKTALTRIEEKQAGWLILRTDGSAPSLLDETGTALSGPALSDTDGLTAQSARLRQGVFSVPLPIGERAVIFGAGHCAQALAPLLKTVGFRVTVMDCRAEFAKAERFPQAEQVICGDYRSIADYLTLTAEDYAVVMTSGHSFDLEVQAQILQGEVAYLGVIGSQRKKAAINQKLRERGIPETAIQRVHTPVGTAIKAVTPEEIAVSIAGEMIYERALRREQVKTSESLSPL